MQYKTKSASALAGVLRSLAIEDGFSVEADWQDGGIVRASVWFRNGTKEAGSYGVSVTWWLGDLCLAERRSAFLVHRPDPQGVEKLANLALDCAEREEPMALFRLANKRGVPYRVDGPTVPKASAARQFAVPRADELATHRSANGNERLVLPKRHVRQPALTLVGGGAGRVKTTAPKPAETDSLAAAVAAEAREVGQ